MVQLTPDEVASVVLARQNRRAGTVVLAALTAGLWLFAAGSTVHLVAGYHDNVERPLLAVHQWVHDPDAKPAELLKLRDDLYRGPRTVVLDEGYRPPTAEELEKRKTAAAYTASRALGSAVMQLAGIVAASLAALLSTLLLVLTVRRATLRQVQAVLADISGQLAALDKAARPAGV